MQEQNPPVAAKDSWKPSWLTSRGLTTSRTTPATPTTLSSFTRRRGSRAQTTIDATKAARTTEVRRPVTISYAYTASVVITLDTSIPPPVARATRKAPAATRPT